MMKLALLTVVAACISANGASAFEFNNVERNDPTCEKSMRLVKKKFGKPDEVLQLSSNSISVIYRTQRLHFTFEIVGKTCTVTSSDF